MSFISLLVALANLVGCAPSTSGSAEAVTADAPFAVASLDGSVTDGDRSRTVPMRVFAPLEFTGPTPIVLVSHGGPGSEFGWTRGNHLGETLAERGFLAIHVGHLPSEPGVQVADRPADVSFVLDQIALGNVALPAGFDGTPDLERVGHAGHSFGAYTSHAVGGATFVHGTYVDERIDAIAPISPQGASGGLGGFDRGGDDHTWATVDVPSLILIGSEETDTNATGTVNEPDWRLTPFRRYDDTADRFMGIVGGQDHEDMYERGSDDVKALVADRIAGFFEVYVADDPDATPCDLTTPSTPIATEWSTITSPNGPLVDCSDDLAIDRPATTLARADRRNSIRPR